MIGKNRCVECNKFCMWEELRETRFVPDHEDGSGNHPEEQEFTCVTCLDELYLKKDKND